MGRFVRRIYWESWHIDGGDDETLCGLDLAFPSEYERAFRQPLDEKSCETCLRLDSREVPDGES